MITRTYIDFSQPVMRRCAVEEEFKVVNDKNVITITPTGKPERETCVDMPPGPGPVDCQTRTDCDPSK